MTTNPTTSFIRSLPGLLLVLSRLWTVDSFCPTRRVHGVRHPSLSNGPRTIGRIQMQWESDTVLAAADLFDDSQLPPVPLVLLGGVAVVVAAQLFINRLAEGDGGLGAFLNDGRGYSNSAFVLDDDNRAVSSDPLPWLKLPKLDYVEVAGQEDDQKQQLFLDRLRGLQEEMEASLERGDYEAATRFRSDLEKLLSDNSARLDS